MSDTPETDALEGLGESCSRCVPSRFARQLERRCLALEALARESVGVWTQGYWTTEYVEQCIAQIRAEKGDGC